MSGPAMDRLEVELEECQDELEELRFYSQHQDDVIYKLENVIRDWETDYDLLQSDNNDLGYEVEHLKKEIDDRDDRIASLEWEIEQLERQGREYEPH